MKFSVQGIFKNTGETLEMSIDAPDESTALCLAEAMGMAEPQIVMGLRLVRGETDESEIPGRTLRTPGIPTPRRPPATWMVRLQAWWFFAAIVLLPLILLFLLILSRHANAAIINVFILLYSVMVVSTLHFRRAIRTLLSRPSGARFIYSFRIIMLLIAAIFSIVFVIERSRPTVENDSWPPASPIHWRQTTQSGPIIHEHPSMDDPIPAPTQTMQVAEWIDADKPAIHEDVRVVVNSCRIGRVRFKDSESDNELLIIELQITNLGLNTDRRYHSWRLDGSSLRLTDDQGNRCLASRFDIPFTPIGGIQSAMLFRGNDICVRDIVTFQKPRDDAKYLNLELAARRFSADGAIGFRIPTSMIHK